MQAKLHISAEALYLLPIKTSGERYYLVCMRVEKWWWIQQAFPKSAIFILKFLGNSCRRLNWILPLMKLHTFRPFPEWIIPFLFFMFVMAQMPHFAITPFAFFSSVAFVLNFYAKPSLIARYRWFHLHFQIATSIRLCSLPFPKCLTLEGFIGSIWPFHQRFDSWSITHFQRCLWSLLPINTVKRFLV